MLNLLDRIKGKKSPKKPAGEVKCTCGETVLYVPNDISEMYLCQKCNKLLCYVEPPPLFRIKPLSLAWLKKK